VTSVVGCKPYSVVMEQISDFLFLVYIPILLCAYILLLPDVSIF
jgi:hypothetical protein